MYQRDLAFASGGLGVILLRNGDTAGASQRFRTQSELLRSLADADPGNANPRIWLGESIRNAGNTLLAEGETSAGRQRLVEAATTLEAIVAADPADVSARTELAQTYESLGKSYFGRGGRDDVEARSWYVKARAQYLDLRREGKLAPSVQTLLTRIDQQIAQWDAGSGE